MGTRAVMLIDMKFNGHVLHTKLIFRLSGFPRS
jgi:hypothetical protein